MRKTKMVKKKNSQGKRMETNRKSELLFAKKNPRSEIEINCCL